MPYTKIPMNPENPLRELLNVIRRVDDCPQGIACYGADIPRYAVVTVGEEHDIAADVRGALAPVATATMRPLSPRCRGGY